ncbi:MAG TPA: PH domain-containing protein [Methylomirabilota bacterium]
MSTDIRVLTGIALALPLVLAVGGGLGRGPARGILLGVTALVLVLYASVWLLWRPTAFEVDAAGLRILWPLRARGIPAREIGETVVLSREAFRREFGWGMRIGAGGLWGGFGWLYTSKGLLGLYVSRTDRVVLVRLRTGRPLLVTPEGDDRFVAALRAVSRG